MLFDRVLEDSLGFIRRKLWSEKNDSPVKKPFQPTKSISGDFGIIHLLEGRDTPRAVRTWMYTPKRKQLNSSHMVATSTPMDLHIYMDFLGPLPDSKTATATQEREAIAQQRQQGGAVPTHRLQILKASHFLNKSGFYDCDLIFWKDVDCCPPKSTGLPEKSALKIAMRLADALAFKCLELPTPLKIKAEGWDTVVNETWAEVQAKIFHAQ